MLLQAKSTLKQEKHRMGDMIIWSYFVTLTY